MRLSNRLLGTGLAVVMGIGFLTMPVSAQAQSRTNENQHRNNALILGAAGLILSSSHQRTLGTIALAGAAYEAYRLQTDIEKRHDERYGYNRSTRDGYYDRNGRWHSTTSNRTRYGSSQTNRYYDRSDRRDDDRDDRDDRNWNNRGNREGRGPEWAATRGKKKGWDKNGKRD